MNDLAAFVPRGAMEQLDYDIFCPLMGDNPTAPNYYARSCRSRIKSGTCSKPDCSRRQETVVKPVPVKPEPIPPAPPVATTKRGRPAESDDRPGCKCCGQVRKLPARGLCIPCQKELVKAGTIDTLYPSARSKTKAKPVKLTLDGDLARRLREAAKKSGVTPQVEAETFIRAYLDFLGIK